MLHFYNGIYCTWDKKNNTSQCRKWNSIMWKSVKLYQLWSEIMKENPQNIKHSSDLRSWLSLYIQYKGMYLKTLSLKSSLLQCVFIKLCLDKKEHSVCTINWVFGELPVFTIWVISLLCMTNDFKFKANYGLCYVSYFIEAEWNTLI